MDFEGLDLNLLVALDALLSEKNVTRAAERTYVSQPAMSASLQKLRIYLDDPLLERVGRQFELSPRAHALAGPLKELLHRVRNLVEGETTFDPQSAQRSFRLAMTSYCTELLGVRLVQHLARVSPGISCQLEELALDTLTRVHAGHVDVCIALGHYAPMDGAYEADGQCEQLLFTDELVLVGAANNPLLDGPVDYESFCKQQHVEVRIDAKMLSTIEKALQQKEMRPHIIASVSNFQHAMSIISGTRIVTIMPSRLVALYGEYFGLRTTRSPLRLNHLDETMYWHPRNQDDLGHRWLREQIELVASDLPEASVPFVH